MIELIDILFILAFSGILLIFVILVLSKKIEKSAIIWIALLLCGLAFVWVIASIERLGSQTLPVWIQAVASISLLTITAIYTYATFQIVKANQALVESNQFDRESKIIKDIVQRIYLPIIARMQMERDSFERGYNIVKFFNDQKVKPEDIGIVDSPNDSLMKQIHQPDSILKKYLPEIKTLCDEFDNYYNRLHEINVKIFLQKDAIWVDFQNICDNLHLPETNFINKEDYETLLSFVIADVRTLKKVYLYQFFDENREALRSMLLSSQMRETIEEYATLKKEFINYSIKFENILTELIHEWQRKYYLIDSELQDPFMIGAV